MPKTKSNTSSKSTKTNNTETIQGQDKIKKMLDVSIKENMPALLIGETGVGKTSVVRELADKHQKKFVRFNLTGETTVDEFVGKYTLIDGETVWQDGILPQALKNGSWLVVDEINAALPEILFVLHSLLDDDQYIVVSNHEGEIVKPHKDFRFFATMNPTDEYAGTKELNKAFKSRFPVILEMGYPSYQVEVDILKDRASVPEHLAVQMVDIANRLRELKDEDKLFYSCSTRDLIQWAKLCTHMESNEAFTLAVLNKALEEKDTVIKIYEDVVGVYTGISKEEHLFHYDVLGAEIEKLQKERKELDKQKDDIKKQVLKEIQQGVKQIDDTLNKKASKPRAETSDVEAKV